jgi:3-dehydroquinate synthase
MNGGTLFIDQLSALNAHPAVQAENKKFILVDSNTHVHCLLALQTACSNLRDVEILEIEAGEDAKDIEVAASLWQALIELGADRNSCLICLGGGVVTDLGAFVASTFKRGIPFILVPTTLLAMIDAAIGGKTGVNVGAFKNQAGTFAEPTAIVIDYRWLRTLPDAELRSGYAEMLKHALLEETNLLNTFLALPSVEAANLIPYIKPSQATKLRIVELDPTENGERKMLNFGHTAGHAIESWARTSDRPLLHGEAIAFGMRVALMLSEIHAQFDPQLRAQIDAHIQTVFHDLLQPADLRKQSGALWQFMLADKKNEAGEVRFVLLNSPGCAVLSQAIDRDQFETALALL